MTISCLAKYNIDCVLSLAYETVAGPFRSESKDELSKSRHISHQTWLSILLSARQKTCSSPRSSGPRHHLTVIIVSMSSLSITHVPTSDDKGSVTITPLSSTISSISGRQRQRKVQYVVQDHIGEHSDFTMALWVSLRDSNKGKDNTMSKVTKRNHSEFTMALYANLTTHRQHSLSLSRRLDMTSIKPCLITPASHLSLFILGSHLIKASHPSLTPSKVPEQFHTHNQPTNQPTKPPPNNKNVRIPHRRRSLRPRARRAPPHPHLPLPRQPPLRPRAHHADLR